MIKKLFSFYKRRIQIPVDKNALVLDIGSGDKPHWRADILLDKYIDESYAAQRSGHGKTAVNKPVFDANAEHMPFRDKAFEYVICSHVLEHVENPSKVIEELIRVSKAGYIEVPYEGCSKINDFKSHLWYCKKEDGVLVFTAKKEIAFDASIDSLVSKPKIKKGLSKIFHDNFDDCVVAIRWTDTLQWRVRGEPNMNIFTESMHTDMKYKPLAFLARTILNTFFKIVLFNKKRRQKINFNSLVKDTYRKDSDEVLKKKIYSLD